ncbi:MAG: hypothetical protein GY801_26380 [bacterium]|nr:hypothetical protein [bacterium]
MDEKLKPCPFCSGDSPYIRKVLRDGYEDCRDDPDAFAVFIVCHACACQGGWAKSEGSAKRNWNMRTDNRVRGSFALPLPTTPCMRNRKGRFDMLPGRGLVVHVHP